MESLLQIGLSNAVAALVLAVIAVLVGVLVRRPALTHGLWLLVLVKLITPPLFLIPIDWTDGASRKAEIDAILASLPEVPAEPVAQVEFIPWAEGELFEVPAPAAMPAPAPVTIPKIDLAALEAPVGAPILAGWWHLLGMLWLGGTALWFGLALYRVACFQALLRHAEPASESLAEQVRLLATRLGLKQVPRVLLVPGKLAPMIWTTLHGAKLLLPVELWRHLSPEQRQTLLVHELAHLVRRDHWVRVLEMLTLGLYWWHPIVWVACRQLREAEEQCCDAWVVSTLNGSGRTYAQAIVETLDFLAKARTPTPLLASGVGQVSDLKRRLTMIMRGTTPRSLTWRGLCALLTLATFLLPALPVLGQPGGDRDQAAAIKELREKLAELEKKLAGRPPAVVAPKVADPEALKKAEAELKEAQAALEKKAAEMRDLSKQVAEAQEKVAKLGGRVEATKMIRMTVAGEPNKVGVFRVEGMPGQGKPDVLFLRKVEGQGIAPMPGMPGPVQIEMMLKGHPFPGGPNWQPGPQPGGPDRRIENLERQLERVLQELQEMRRGPQGPGRGPGIGGPGGRPGEPGQPGRPMDPNTRPRQPEPPVRPGQPQPEQPRGR